MPKKSASKTPAPMSEDPLVEQKKPSSMKDSLVEQEKPSSISKEELGSEVSKKSKKPGNEIEEIFSGKKRKKAEEKKDDNAIEDVDVKSGSKTKKKKKTKKSKDSGFVDPPSRPRKRTNDGLVVYTAAELGFGKEEAGGTPLCPFDCTCCF